MPEEFYSINNVIGSLQLYHFVVSTPILQLLIKLVILGQDSGPVFIFEIEKQKINFKILNTKNMFGLNRNYN